MNAPRLRPLYVDLDRTLIAGDVSLEAWLAFARRGIAETLMLAWWLLRGRAFAKAMVARRQPLDPATLPYRAEVLAELHEARAKGRRIVLASGSHHRHVTRIARYLGLFDAAIGTARCRNLKGRHKLAWIIADAAGGFDYIGDARADRPIWNAAAGGRTVGHDPHQQHVTRLACATMPAWRAVVKAMRPHQWAKNALIAVPLATSGLWDDPIRLVRVVAGIACFSLAASGVYLVNDLLDIESDRAHATKRHRPIARGALSIPVAIMLASALLVLVPLATWVLLGRGFALVLVGYLALTSAYSFRLKQVMTLDVIVLACLYTLRIFAGGVAARVEVSSWLLTFAIFFFLSLAYMKRYAELAVATSRDRLLSGRGYVGGDVEIVMMSGIATGMVSILVLALFISSAAAQYANGTPALLWGLCLILLYWLTRIWMMARRGEVPGDPIAFAVTDRRSLALGVIAVVLVIASQRLHITM